MAKKKYEFTSEASIYQAFKKKCGEQKLDVNETIISLLSYFNDGKIQARQKVELFIPGEEKTITSDDTTDDVAE